MKKQRQKWVCFLAVLTLVLAVLRACGTQPEQEEEPAPVQETEPKGTEASAGNTVDMGDYVLTLPKDCTQQAREDGGLSFLCDGAPVGGVQTLDCPGADQVDWDDLTGYKEVLPTLWSQFLEEGEGTPDYIASPAAGSGADLEVSLVTDQRSESHYLFAAGDQVYDLWFSDPNPLPSYDVSGTVRSFALQSK